MKNILLVLVLSIIPSISVFCQETQKEFPVLEGPYLGQKPPGLVPELFGRSVISTGAYEHGSPVFTNDLNEIYWTLNVEKEGKYETTLTFMMKCINGKWSKPEIPDIFKDFDLVHYPFITADGTKMFFSAGYILARDTSGRVDYTGKISYTNRINDRWGVPVCLDSTINPPNGDTGGPTVSKSGTLFYSIYYKNQRDSSGLFYSLFNNGKYSAPIRMPKQFKQSRSDYTPYIAPDENYYIFASIRPGGYGMGDLYISFKRKDGSWSDAINMGNKINTSGNERFPNVSPDGKYLFFNSSRKIQGADSTSAGNGTGDVYWVDISVIENLRKEVFNIDK